MKNGRGEGVGKVMVIDNEPLTLKNLRHILEKAGYKVSTFSSPLRALKRLEEHLYGVIITDPRIPYMDGFGRNTTKGLPPKSVIGNQIKNEIDFFKKGS